MNIVRFLTEWAGALRSTPAQVDAAAQGWPTLRKVVALTPTVAPFGIPSNGTIATNGTVTLVSAFRMIYDGGLWLYFPAGAVSGGSAGLYWTVMSSTTVGTVYTDYYNPATAEQFPVRPAGALTVATGSNSAYTSPTGAVNIARWLMPANTLVPGDVLYWSSTSVGSGTGNKIVSHTIDGVAIITNLFYTTVVGVSFFTALRLLPGTTQRQTGYANSYLTNNGTLFSSHNFAAQREVLYSLRNSTPATDTVVVDMCTLRKEAV